MKMHIEAKANTGKHSGSFPAVVKPINVSSIKQLSVFRYPGGKTWFVPLLRRWLLALDQKPRLLIEAFGGGGIVTLTAINERLATRALLVEKDPAIASVWRVCLSDEAFQLAEQIRKFDFDPNTVVQQIETCRRSDDPVDVAFSVILLNRIRRGGVMAPGAGILKQGENGNGLTSRWYPETLAKRIEAIHSLRDRIEFREGDGLEAIEEYRTHKSSAIFADPPYTKAGKRLYAHWQLDHQKFLQRLSRIKGNFLVTYDDTEEVRTWADESKIQWTQIAMRTTGHSLKHELVLGRDLAWLSSSS